MKIASWNIRGFGIENKLKLIKTLMREENLDLIGLIEAKHSEVSRWVLRKC